MSKNLLPSLSIRTVSNSKDIAVNRIIETGKENAIAEAKKIFNFLKERVYFFCKPVVKNMIFSEKVNALREIYSKKQYLTVFRELFGDLFFQSLSFAAFCDHGVIELWTTAYIMLTYIAHNCRWADEYLQKFDFHVSAKACLLKEHIPVRPEVIGTFLVELMRISYESFSFIFDEDIFNYFITKLSCARNPSDKIWIFELLLGIFSVEWYDKSEPIEQIVCGFKQEMEKCKDIEYINELCLSCFASILASKLEPEFKKQCVDEEIIDAAIANINPEHETIFSVIVDYFNNAVFFDDGYFGILAEKNVIGIFFEALKELQTKEKAKLKLNVVFFLNTCLALGKPALELISQFEFLPLVIENYDYSPLQLRKEIMFYVCNLMMHSDASQYAAIFEVFPLENIIDALMENEEDMNGRIIIALIQITSALVVASDDNSNIIDDLSDSCVEERLEEFAEMKENPLSEYSLILRKNIISLQKTKQKESNDLL